ncbi:MAG: hypothetical protein Q8P90_02640 [bacterium]|nr:hypothetical protein [bacterium]
MINKKMYAVAIGVFATLTLIGAGCTSTDDATSNDVNTVAVAGMPEGCVVENTLTIQSTEAGTETPLAENSYAIQWTGSEDELQLVFADYVVDPTDIYSNITGERMLAVVYLENTEADTMVDVGTYSKVKEALTQVGELNISTADLAGGVFDDTAEVEITYFGDDFVCGSITADDTYSSINGDFVAKYEARSI